MLLYSLVFSTIWGLFEQRIVLVHLCEYPLESITVHFAIVLLTLEYLSLSTMFVYNTIAELFICRNHPSFFLFQCVQHGEILKRLLVLPLTILGPHFVAIGERQILQNSKYSKRRLLRSPDPNVLKQYKTQTFWNYLKHENANYLKLISTSVPGLFEKFIVYCDQEGQVEHTGLYYLALYNSPPQRGKNSHSRYYLGHKLVNIINSIRLTLKVVIFLAVPFSYSYYFFVVIAFLCMSCSDWNVWYVLFVNLVDQANLIS